MATFIDTAGHHWDFHITVGTVKRIRRAYFEDAAGKQLTVDLLSLNDGDPPLYMRLVTDVALLVDVIEAINEGHIRELNLDHDQFAQRIGDRLGEAIDAFWESLTDFFRQARRPDLAAAVSRIPKVIRESAQAIEREDREDPGATSGNTSTSSPAFAMRTPTV